MAKHSHLSFAVSQEELFVILAYLKAKSMVGLDPEIFKGLDEKQVRLALGVGERALIARGFLTHGSNHHLQLEPPVFATVGACAFPETTILITRTRSKALAENYYFHTSRKMIVMHTIPMTAMHQFIAVEEKSAVTKAILSILDLNSIPAQPYPEGKITRAVLGKARDATLESGSEAVLEILSSQDKMDRETASALAETLAHPVANTTLAYVEKQGETTDGCTILQGEEALWLLSPTNDRDDENALVSVRPVSSLDATKHITALLRL